ncbi:MAG: hypothetical protein EG826_07700 [Deltaproteobacteria bacterium]|nr:hypothetical protein [Deltaproteobacteria bacterium]
MKRGFVLFLVGGCLFLSMAAHAAGVDLTGYWQFSFPDGKQGYMTLAKTGGNGGPNAPSYKGKINISGFGEYNIYCIQTPDYHTPGNAFSINISDPVSLRSFCFTVTGTKTMPGKMCGSGWQGVEYKIWKSFEKGFTANRN